MEAELALINKVELRIALAGTDEKFESLLLLYLAPFLLKLLSPYSQVRTQILKLVQHFITRINAARTIKLPIEKLLTQVQHPVVPEGVDASSVRLYSLVFISKGIDRLSHDEKLVLLPRFAQQISHFTENIQARLFYIFVKLISDLKETDKINLSLDEKDDSFIIEKISNLFLFQPVTNEDGSHKIPLNYTCPGLTNQDCQFLTTLAGITYNSQQLSSVKLPLLILLSLFKTEKKVIPLLIATCDSVSEISDKASSIIKRLSIDYENAQVVDALIQFLIGDLTVNRPAVKVVLQERILSQFLNHSITATRSLQVSKISSSGLNSSYAKLKSSTILFIQWVTQNLASSDDNMETDQDESFNINIAAQLKENLTSESWDSSSGKNFQNYLTQRRNQYQALAVILKKEPKLLTGLTYVDFLFESLIQDLPELRSTIQDALSGLTVHLPHLEDKDKFSLKSTLSEFLIDDTLIMTSPDQQRIEGLLASRYILVKYINCCFPFDDAEARLLCALGTSKNNRSNVIEEAMKGLHPYWFNILQSSNTLDFKSTPELLGGNKNVKFPRFQDMVKSLKLLIDISEGKQFATIRSSMSTAVTFVIQCLVMQSIEDHRTIIVNDQEWSVRLEKALEFDEIVLKLISEELTNILLTEDKYFKDFENNTEWNSVDILLSTLAKEFLGKDLRGKRLSISTTEPKIVFGKMFIKILSLSHKSSVSNLTFHLKDFYQLIIESSASASDDFATYIAQSIGIIATHPTVTDEEFISYVKKFTDNLESPHRNSILLTLGYLVSRLSLRGRESVLTGETYALIFNHVLDGLKSTESRRIGVSMEAISQLSIFGSLGPELNLVSDIEKYRSLFVEELLPKVKKANEKAVTTWSHLSLTYTPHNIQDSEELTAFEQAVYDTHVSKQVEYLFTSGEALTIIAAGWNSKVLKRLVDVHNDEIVIKIPSRDFRLPSILDKVLKACFNTKPSLRRLGCIWLLSLVQYLSHLSAITDRAPEIHVAFMRFLADRDELIQESASRGLTLVYEIGDVELKDTLVRGLLKSFTDSTSSKTLAAGTVSAETELFEPGVLKTEDGSVSTYKDILNLATEVGDPSLVYKFMSLARHSALWSSRKGIAFGLGSILSKSSLDDLLASDQKLSKKLIPKLFRYRFDPSPTVSKSMNDIWNTLISDSSKAIISNLDSIFEEVLKGMGNKEWRTRQASTSALADLIQSLSFEKYESRLEEIWNMSLRSVDDIKESVRKEGNKLSRSLASILVRSINVESGASLLKANSVLTKLVPTLLGTQGLLNDVEDIRNFALETILSLCKKSGVAIKPFIPTLISQLITLMSTLEPQIINYLTLNADKYNMKASDIDAKRLQSIGHSPMMDAIEKLLDLVDDDSMKELVPALQTSIRTSVGLPSKAAGSRVLVTLVVRHLYVVKPYGDQLLKTCQQQLKDKNETISSSYATAAGYLCRIASIEAVVKFSKYLQKMYFESEIEQQRKVAGISTEAVSKYSGDTFSKVASAFLPFAFVAKYDPEKSVADFFETAWSDNTAGNGAIKLYIQEITDLVNKNINSQQYLIRQVCAKSIADACNKMDNGANGIGSSATQLFEVLIATCKGRSWSGKEHVLESLVSLSIKSKFFLLKDEHGLLEKVNKVILTEARRNNKQYKLHAVKSMGNYVKEFDELVDEYVGIMREVVNDDFIEDDDDEETESKKLKLEESKSSRKNLKREEERLSILGDMVSTFKIDEEHKHYHQNLLALIFDSITDLFQTSTIIITWRSQVAVCKYLNTICGQFVARGCKLELEETTKLKIIYKNLHKILDFTIENVIIQFIRSIKQIVAAINDDDFRSDIISDMRDIDKRPISSVIKTELASLLKNF